MRTLNLSPASRSDRCSAFSRIALLAVLVVSGCQKSPPPPERPLADVRAGVHHFRLEVPRGWQHADHGNEQRFERGLQQISMSDLGPVSSTAFRREIRRAQALFRRGQVEDSAALMRRLNFRRAVAEDYRFEKLKEPWVRLCNVDQPPGPSYHEAQWDYEQLLAQLTSLSDPDLDRLADQILDDLNPHGLRDVAERERFTLDGLTALRVDTWHRLSHDHRKRHLFVLNEGNLLVFHTEMGTFDELEEPFDRLIASLQLAGAQGAS